MAKDKRDQDLNNGDLVIPQARVEEVRENEGVVLLQGITRDFEARIQKVVTDAAELDARQRKQISDLQDELARRVDPADFVFKASLVEEPPVSAAPPSQPEGEPIQANPPTEQ